jgi:hypothetical protein
VQEQKIRASILPITDLVAPPLLFPHLKFQQKRLILWANGMRTPRGMPFERKLEGHICSDNAVGARKISLFLRLRTLVASGTFCLLYAAVGKK